MRTFAGYSIVGILLLFGKSAGAVELREIGPSTRGLGMGNAYTTMAPGSEAFWYNPAAFGRVRGLNWTVAGIDLAANALNMSQTIGKISAIESVEDYSELYGEYVWVGLNGNTSVTFPGFGVAYYTNAVVDFELKNPSLPQLDATYMSDVGIAIGGAYEAWDGGYFGILAKRVVRQGGSESSGVSTVAGGDLTSVMDGFNAQGVGYGIDLGMLVELEGPFNPVFSVAWKDVGYTTFVAVEGMSAPPIQRDNLSIGFGSSMELPLVTISAALDVRHLRNQDEQFGKKVHIGTEISLPMLDLRAGLNQGYATYGVGLDLFLMRFDVASYGVERGVYLGQQEDRRFQIELKIEFGLDPDFNLFGTSSGGPGSSSSGSKVKRRR